MNVTKMGMVKKRWNLLFDEKTDYYDDVSSYDREADNNNATVGW